MEVREKAAHGGGLSPVMSGEIHASVVQRVVACYLNDYFLRVLLFEIFADCQTFEGTKVLLFCSLLKITIVLIKTI